VQLWQAELISKGLLRVESGGGRKAVNRYSLNLEPVENSATAAQFTEENSATAAQFEEGNSATIARNSATVTGNSAPIAQRTAKNPQQQPERGARPKFVKPGADEVAAYFAELGAADCAAPFFDYYTANGWKAGRNPMKDWKASARGWARREPEFRSPRGAVAGPRGSAAAEKAFERFAEALRLHGRWRTEKVWAPFDEREWGSLKAGIKAAGGLEAITDRPNEVRERFVAGYDAYGKAGAK
jgi:hypothetical protein